MKAGGNPQFLANAGEWESHQTSCIPLWLFRGICVLDANATFYARCLKSKTWKKKRERERDPPSSLQTITSALAKKQPEGRKTANQAGALLFVHLDKDGARKNKYQPSGGVAVHVEQWSSCATKPVLGGTHRAPCNQCHTSSAHTFSMWLEH